MVRNHHPIHFDMNQAIRLRREAAGLLDRLEANRQANERICVEIGKRDAMRSVTGRSAIERAIETTRGMIRDMDHLLEEAAEAFGDINGDLTANRAEGADRAQHGEHLVQSR